jgi:ABC-type uncharacterized transport system permease subunit
MSNLSATIKVDFPTATITSEHFHVLYKKVRQLIIEETGMSNITRGKFTEPCEKK